MYVRFDHAENRHIEQIAMRVVREELTALQEMITEIAKRVTRLEKETSNGSY
jgi:hypothetical protein